MLYLVATPIGNLKDISLRALDVLKKCDYILCEDTRHSGILLQEYDIKKPLKSFHMFNEKSQEDKVVEDLKEGKNIALISDAGTPGICDPGEELVKRCQKEGLEVTGIPGPCAWVLALSLSSMNKDKVQFLGFLPKKEKELNKTLTSVLTYSGTSIFYDTPHQILSTLESIVQFDPLRPMCIMRELTKKFEEHLEDTAEKLLAHFQKEAPRGEMVVLVRGQHETFKELPPEEHVQLLQKTYNLPLSEAIKVCAELRGVPKRTIYNELHHSDDC